MGAPRAIALCQSFNGALAFQARRWESAETALQESIQLFRQIGAADGEALSCQRLGLLWTAQGRLDEALAVLEDGVLAAEHAKLRAHVLGRLHATVAQNRLYAGDLDAAVAALTAGEALAESHGHCPLCEALLLPVAVSVRIALGDLAAAEADCRRLDEATTHYGSRVWVALAAKARGDLAAAQGDHATAKEYWGAAQAGFATAKNYYAAAECERALADLAPTS